MSKTHSESKVLSKKTQTFKKLSENIEASKTLHLRPKQAAQAFQEPRPQIITAVEDRDFNSFDDLREWCRENIDNYSEEDMKTLFELNVIGHPTKSEDSEENTLTTHTDQPLEVTPDMIICVPYDKETGYISDGIEKRRENS